MSYSKDAGEVSARYRSAGDVTSVTYPSGTAVTEGTVRLFNGEVWIDEDYFSELAAIRSSGRTMTDEDWIALWARHDQYPA